MHRFVQAMKFFGDPLSVADVANRAQHIRSLFSRNRTEADFDWKLRSVVSSAIEIQIRTHTARLRGFGKVSAMALVFAAITLRYQQVDTLSNQLVGFVSKQFLRLRVDLHNASVAVDGYDGIGQSFKQFRREQGFRRILSGRSQAARTLVARTLTVRKCSRRLLGWCFGCGFLGV